MRKFIICGLLLLFFGTPTFAKLTPISLNELISNSNLIVIGTLKNISEEKKEGDVTGKGDIFIEQIVGGNVKTINGNALKTGDILELKYFEGFACVYGSHKRVENEKGIFLLTLNSDGEIFRDSFRSLKDLPEIEKLLKKGIVPNEIFKTVKLSNETISKSENEENAKVSFCIYSMEKRMNYNLFFALFVIFGAIGLYYFLYRSRFKIR
ncbi:MAG TPA: hypothetical protein PKY59_22705 [Pyrinomonadaceae bacterium]|nr:hypothetical protein [Pyrinomonadaceae bacterium]